MAEKKGATCAHPGCNCAVLKDSKYCSPYCGSADTHLPVACECGHTECATAATGTAGASE